MASRNALNLDVRGLIEAQAQLALIALPPQMRKRLLNRVALRLRTTWRKRVRDQRDVSGTSFRPRADKRKKKKMLAGLAKALGVPRLTPEEVELGWGRKLNSVIAGANNAGMTQRVTASQMRRWKRLNPLMSTRAQAKKLRQLGYKVLIAGKNKRGRPRYLRPSLSWIQENVRYAQAGMLIRLLKDESPGPQAWKIVLPKREFFGPASAQEVCALVEHLLPQILRSPI
jgi:hypothetical protein